MQIQYVGGVGDFAKLALLGRLMMDRRLAVCWYLTGAAKDTAPRQDHFEYLTRPDEFRHLAPEVFDRCKAIAASARDGLDPVTAVQTLRQQDRALIISHRQSGRRDEVKFLIGRLREIGCRQIELIRFRLVSSRFFVICDHNEVLSERLAAFVKQWGDRIKSYAL